MNQLDSIKNQISAIRRASGRQHYKVSISELCGALDHLISALEDRFAGLEHVVEKPQIFGPQPTVIHPTIPGAQSGPPPSPLRPHAEKRED